MKQAIRQNGVTIMPSPENASCNMIFCNLTGKNFGGKEYELYVKMMLSEFPNLTYGEIELWEDGKLKDKGNITKYLKNIKS